MWGSVTRAALMSLHATVHYSPLHLTASTFRWVTGRVDGDQPLLEAVRFAS